MKKWIGIGLAGVALAILAGVGGYFVGLARGESRAQESMMEFARDRMNPDGQQSFLSSTRQPGQIGQGRGFGQGGTMGTVASIEGDTMTLTTQDATVEIKVTDTTLVQKTMSVALDQLEVGEQVTVSGTQNDDGSITARSIQALRAGQFSRVDQP
jgi:hypothetical protein